MFFRYRTTAFLFAFILLGTLLCSSTVAGEPRTQVERSASDVGTDSKLSWDSLFLANGQLRDAIGPNGNSHPNGIPDVLDLGGYSAVFVRDGVSSGHMVDETAPTRFGSGSRSVDPQHDLTNAYLYSRPDVNGNLVIHIGSERLSSLGESYIEFELNQRIYRLEDPDQCGANAGESCRFRRGHRTPGDLKVRLSFGSDGFLESGEVSKWVASSGSEDSRFVEIAFISGEGCLNGDDLCVRLNDSPLRSRRWQSYDERGNIRQEIPARGLAEVTLNVGALLGFNPCLSNFQVRTPQDYALGYFDSCRGGDYEVDLTAATTGTYTARTPRDLVCPASVTANGEVGFGGRSDSPFTGAGFDNGTGRRTILSTESLYPEQIVPFRISIQADERAHPKSAVDFSVEWRDAISAIPFSQEYGVYCAFVQGQSQLGVSDDTDSRVEFYSSASVEGGILSDFRVSGLDPGESVTVEAWLVLDSGSSDARSRADTSLIASQMLDVTASGWTEDPLRIHEKDVAFSIENGCLEDNTTHSGLSCTSSDVQIASVVGVNVIQGCASPGAEAVFDLTVELVARNQRYDVGIYMATDGGDARTGACLVEALPVPGFPSHDTDSCGDIDSSSCPESNPCTFTIFGITALCVDPDHDGLLELGSCLSWDQNSGGVCNNPEDVAPGSPSKCRCAILDIDEIRIPPEISVEKSANPKSVPETGENVTFTFSVVNEAIAAVTLTSLIDDVFGDLTLYDPGDCSVPQTLDASGGAYTCSITAFVEGEARSKHTNVLTATATNADGTAVKTDDAEVSFEDVLPDISVTKTADPTSVLETGEDVTFTFLVVNNSAEEATLDSLDDDYFGDLNGLGDCVVPQTLAAAGGTYSCSLTAEFSGEPDEPHINVVTATASDNDGNSDTETDDATVSFIDVLPDISMAKTADPTTVLETGADVEFTFTVTNNSAEEAVLDTLSDSVFGNLNGQGSCNVGGVLTPSGGQYTCSVTVFIQGDADEVHTNVGTAVASDNDGNTDSASDDAEVTILNADPVINVDKSAEPNELLTTGGLVTYTVTVANNSAPSDPVTITSVTDVVWSDLNGDGEVEAGDLENLDYTTMPGSDCGSLLGTQLAAGESVSCTYTRWVAGPAWLDPLNTVTVTGEDDEGSTDTDSDTAQVNLAYMAWTPGFWKNHAKGKHNAWDYCLAYDTGTLVGEVFSSELLNLAPVRVTGRRIRVSETIFADLTLLDALRLQGGDEIPGAIEILLRAATASLLNACYHESVGNQIGNPDDIFPVTTDAVINQTNGALDSGDRGTIIGLAGVYDSYNNGIGEFDWTQPLP